jgi:tRNA-dihydrouridine synthase B
VNNHIYTTALAPMQAITGLPFMRVLQVLGAPDYFFTEYFRVHETSSLDKPILDCIVNNTSGKPIYAQVMGENIPALKKTVKELIHYPISGIDLNMGCPAPKIYKKNVGGGLLRDLAKADAIIGELRAAIPMHFSVKMRIGFDNTDSFEALLDIVNKHQVDLLSLHARTVKELYGPIVHYEFITQAVQTVKCPVFANGNLTSVDKFLAVLKQTKAAGGMIGRSAIRNPWIFRQIREYAQGLPVYRPQLKDVYTYIQLLHEQTADPEMPDARHVNQLKKFLNFIGISVDPQGLFLNAIRRAITSEDLFSVCKLHLLQNENAEQYFSDEPYLGLVARPNRESLI